MAMGALMDSVKDKIEGFKIESVIKIVGKNAE